MKRMICVLLILVSSFLTGCGGPYFDEEKYFQDADPNTPLMITYPTDGMVVKVADSVSAPYTLFVQGIGYEEGMYLTVKTDRWYEQTPAIVHDPRTNSWYSYVYLGGYYIEGYVHTIRAVAPSGEIHEVRVTVTVVSD